MLAETFKHSLQITAFVLSMMLVIEYFTVQSQYKIIEKLSKNIWIQVIIAAFLGIIPGCLGTFLAISLYAHNVFNLSSLVTVMIATSGDEAFVMFAEMPQKALILNAIIFGIAVATGIILNIILKNKTFINLQENHLKFHHNNIHCKCFDKELFWQELKNITFERFLLILFSFLFTIAILTEELGPKKWNYIKISLLITGVLILFISISVPNHFLSEHLWKHTIKKHLPRIFIWTFVALLIINILLPYLGISEEKYSHLAEKYQLLILFLAVLVGIIPESGPHLVFLYLFLNGYIPFSILLANSIVQDGHGGLPLLAESQKSFLAVKGLNMIVGFLIGLAGYLFNF